MTYSTEDESAMELPRWAKWMRGLVMTLLVVSILAMLSVAWAAFRIVGNALADNPEWPEVIELPENASPVSVTKLPSGQFIVVYENGETYKAGLVDSDGIITEEASFE